MRARVVIETDLFFIFITGAAIMLLSFIANLVYLKETPASVSTTAVEFAD